MKKFNVTIYQLTDKSLMCPESDIKAGDYCISFHPLRKVDPRGWYAFVTTADGETHSVSKRFLKAIDQQTLEYNPPRFCTAHQERVLELQAMKQYIANYKPKEHAG